jgi:hypothetical protein
MSATIEPSAYRSPRSKLVRFFLKSRNGWKHKCQQARASVKRLTNGVRALERSRDRWKTLAKQRDEELRRLRREGEAQKMSRP